MWQAGEAGTQDQGDASLPPGLEERRAEDRVWQGLQAEALKAQGIQAPAKAPGDARWPLHRRETLGESLPLSVLTGKTEVILPTPWGRIRQGDGFI